LICAAGGDQSEPHIAPDGWNGSYVVWLDARSGVRNDLFAQRVAVDGTPAPGWPSDGHGVVAGMRDCREPRVTAYGGDRAFVVWRDVHADGGDICVTQLLPGSGVPSDAGNWTPSALAIEAWPNPATTGLHVAWRLPTTQSVTLEVFDVRGRRVRTWAPGVLGAGAHRSDWNGRDENGARLPAGVYWIRVRGQVMEGTRKVVLAR